MSHNVTPNTSRVELRKTLTLVPVVMMGLAYMQPMTLLILLVSFQASRMVMCRQPMRSH